MYASLRRAWSLGCRGSPGRSTQAGIRREDAISVAGSLLADRRGRLRAIGEVRRIAGRVGHDVEAVRTARPRCDDTVPIRGLAPVAVLAIVSMKDER